MHRNWRLSGVKNAPSISERQRKKAALADQLNKKTGIDKAHCTEALDLLEAAIFNVVTQGQQSNVPQQLGTGALKAKPISIRTIIFGLAAAIGGFIGSLIGGAVAMNIIASTLSSIILHWTSWQLILSIGIIISLIIAHSIYLKQKLAKIFSLKPIMLGLLISIAVGVFSGIVVAMGRGNNISRTIAWAGTGLGIGFVSSLIIPKLSKNYGLL